MSLERFTQALPEYLSAIGASGTEATIRHRCLEFLRDALGIELLESGDQLERPVFRCRIDAVLGRLVFDFKRDPSNSLTEAEAQLEHYLTELHHQDPPSTYTGVACDGRRIAVYYANYDSTGKATLQAIGNLDLEAVSDTEKAYRWLDGLFAHFRADHQTGPIPAEIGPSLGAESLTFRHATLELLELLQLVKATPLVEVKLREWQACMSAIYRGPVGDEALFVRHTYLALVARLIARSFIDGGPEVVAPQTRAHDLRETIGGDFFNQRDINNFVEDDFFTWLLSPVIDGPGLNLVARLSATLSCYQTGRDDPGLLASLYRELVDPPEMNTLGQQDTPPWLAEYILDQELDLSSRPDQSILDPCCGSGSFLSTAIRLISRSRQNRGEDPFDTLLGILNQVMGMDRHPLAVTIARTNYLLALGDLVQGTHPAVLIPVYMSDAAKPTEASTEIGTAIGDPEPVYAFAPGQTGSAFHIPDSVACNPEMLDWLFTRVPNYMKGAAQRIASLGEQRAVQAVLTAFHNYLVAPKPRTPIPEPLRPYAAEVMVGTAEKLVKLYLQGHHYLWLFILKNMAAPVYLARRKFDLVVGHPAGPASGFLGQTASLYLKESGRVGLVLPRTELFFGDQLQSTPSPNQAGPSPLALVRVVDLAEVSPLFGHPACVLIAAAGETALGPVPATVLRGGLPHRHASWQEAAGYLQWEDSEYTTGQRT